MRSLPRAVGSVVLAFALAACSEDPSLETRTFTLEHRSPNVAVDIIAPYVFQDRPGAEGAVTWSDDARTITVRELPDNLDRIGRVLSETDQPGGSVNLRFQVIEAGPEPVDPDPAIEDVEVALREAFRFQGYRLVAEAVVRAAEYAEFDQSIAGVGAYSIAGRVDEITGGVDGPTRARVAVSFWTDPEGRALETTVNVTDGRTIVVGTAGSDPGGALILVVRPAFEF